MTWFKTVIIRGLERLIDVLYPASAGDTTTRHGLRIGTARYPYGRNRSHVVRISLDELSKHLVIAGATGAGKTCLIMVLLLSLLSAGLGAMFLDIHDCVPRLLTLVARLVSTGILPPDVLQRIAVVSFDTPNHIVRFNPLARLAWMTPHRVGQQMAAILKRQWPDASWGAPSTELIANTFCLMAEHGLPLTMTEQLLQNPMLLQRYCRTVNNEACRQYFTNRWLHLSDRMRDFYTRVFLPRLSVFLADPRFRAMFGSTESDINLRNVMDRSPSTLLLIDLNKGLLGAESELAASLWLMPTQHAAYSRLSVPEANRRLFPVVLEEFGSLPTVHTCTLPYLNEFRKLKTPIVLITQSFAADERTVRAAMLGNAGTVISFRLGSDDGQVVTAGLSGEERELVKQRLARLTVGQALLFSGGGSPQPITVDHVAVPIRLTAVERQMIDRMRRNIGVPLETAIYENHTQTHMVLSRPDAPQPAEETETNPQYHRTSPSEFDLPPDYEEGTV